MFMEEEDVNLMLNMSPWKENHTPICTPLWRNHPNHIQLWMKGAGVKARKVKLYVVRDLECSTSFITWKLKLKVFQELGMLNLTLTSKEGLQVNFHGSITLVSL